MLNRLKESFSKLNVRMKTHSQECYRQMITFGIFGAVAYPGFGILNMFLLPQKHYENFTLRLIAGIACMVIALNRFWPLSLKRFMHLYWYLLLIFALPFFFVFMLLHNHLSNVWLLNLLTVIFFTILVVDWVSALIIFTIGSILAAVVFFTTYGTPFLYKPGFIPLPDFVGAFIVTVILGILFSRNKQLAEKEKFATINEISANVAHELRTPLASISAQVAGLKQWLPMLLSAYQKAAEQNLGIKTISTKQMKHLTQSPDKIKAEVGASFHFIDMLLVSAKKPSVGKAEDRFSLTESINEALRRYPFQGHQRDLVSFDGTDDFVVQANGLLINHVFFNLLKNALHHVSAKAGERGKITIKLDAKSRRVYFKDTGTGIAAKDLRRIFDRFYSKTHHGTGIGLAFCKSVMEGLGGQIDCRSVKDEYTEFILTFPHVKGETK